MNTPNNQDQQDASMSNKDMDVTRSQNREGAASGNTADDQMGTTSEDTGSRPSNNNKNNQQQQVNLDATGSHGEGQYPRNAVQPEGLSEESGSKAD
ncbi:MAG: hypothetical protein EOP52_00605 [Sphingobacteriales bacterium]|nr:MAG: hypothetical protein EOP52_00605 [Sphingobacteriales bacterium]